MHNSEFRVISFQTVIPFIFLIEASSAMQGRKISIVNEAIIDTILKMRRFSDYKRIRTEIAVMTYSYNAEWVGDMFVDINDYIWSDPTVGGPANLEKALVLLNSSLSNKVFNENESLRYMAPVIGLVATQTSNENYVDALERLKKNRWFKVAKKYAVTLEGGYDYSYLRDFIGNNSVYGVYKLGHPSELFEILMDVYNKGLIQDDRPMLEEDSPIMEDGTLNKEYINMDKIEW